MEDRTLFVSEGAPLTAEAKYDRLVEGNTEKLVRHMAKRVSAVAATAVAEFAQRRPLGGYVHVSSQRPVPFQDLETIRERARFNQFVAKVATETDFENLGIIESQPGWTAARRALAAAAVIAAAAKTLPDREGAIMGAEYVSPYVSDAARAFKETGLGPIDLVALSGQFRDEPAQRGL